jgi:hypothetical protein
MHKKGWPRGNQPGYAKPSLQQRKPSTIVAPEKLLWISWNACRAKPMVGRILEAKGGGLTLQSNLRSSGS